MGVLHVAAQVTEEITTTPEALVNTGLGMGTVFVVLILISFVIYLMKFIPILLGMGKKKEAPKEVQQTQVASAEVVEQPVEVTDDAQLVAVIMAAIAASMSEETGVPVTTDGLIIRSIKKRTFSI